MSKVSAALVTRGDVPLDAIIGSLETSGVIDEIVVYDNSVRPDMSVYGRYIAVSEAKHPLIYVQDDDVLHTPEGIQHIVQTWIEHCPALTVGWCEIGSDQPYEGIVCNMPANFRHSFYEQHSLVGFGSCFHRDLPFLAFDRFHGARLDKAGVESWFFLRTADIVFTTLTPRILLDVLYEDMPWASAENRMWMQPTHREERQRMLDLCLEVRDAA